MSQLNRLMSRLAQARKASQNAYEAYKTAREAEDSVRHELELKLRADGLKSAKNDDYIVSIVTRPVINIYDERAAIDWLENQPDIETDLYIGLRKAAFDGLVRTAIKSTGEIVPGTEIENNEYLTIKEVKK